MPKNRIWLILPALLLLCGCDLVLLNAKGDVASQQGDLIIYSTVLMLIVILPVIVTTVVFAIKYRSSSESSAYEPDWDHSVSLEVVIWAVPLAIVICLAGLTWVATHRLDPYADLTRISADKAIDETVKPLEIQVIAMDWKWLFVYPEYGVASVNEVAGIVDRPVEWKLTSTTVMTAFYIPDMVGMIYAMAGMETELNGVMNSPGSFRGFASHYNGAGFSKMDFEYLSLDDADFDDWIANAKAAPAELNRDTFLELDEPTIDHEVHYYSAVEDELWNRVINLCVAEGQICMHDMMTMGSHHDRGSDTSHNHNTPDNELPEVNPDGARSHENNPTTTADENAPATEAN